MINAKLLKNAIISGANNINKNRSKIDDLNIFPVPDGDTGTNMSMTINAAAEMLEGLECDDVSTVAQKVASSMLRGARGNSGVILSLIFRGFAVGLKDKENADGKDLVEALGKGVEAAYKAVMKPTEGTILTVARMAYEAGSELIFTENDAVTVWETITAAANEALELTPELLPVLKKANVVDAGGKGLCTIFEGMLSVFRDGEIIEYKKAAASESEEDYFRSAAAQFDDDITYTYCTEFIVGRDPDIYTEADELRTFLQTIGDCVVVVDDEEIIKVHVHTENPGNALQAGLEYGQLLTVKVENMKEQHRKAAEAEKAAKQKEANEKENNEPVIAEPTEDIGFVAVAAGEGLVELFKDCGCANVVSGGQSMNPSTQDILSAVLATPAKKVVVLPNNKNIIMAAEQAVPLVEDRTVIVLPTKTIPQGLSALLAFDPDAEPDTALEMMQEAFANVQTGLVTFAARDSEFGVGLHKIKENEIIALENGKLTITEKDIVKAAVKVTKNLVSKESAFITVISGEGVTLEQSERVVELLTAKYGKDMEISYVNGGQPVYYFIISVE
ncbi:MAG: DAK2 domain-containing protein [Acutalibacteraceae bacterium]|nr:DAK2 domain-containing protein [Clostridia bacterium]MEE3450933.1 DAK2 domain-containing protein [Acutalibacteraceae bacterium]